MLPTILVEAGPEFLDPRMEACYICTIGDRSVNSTFWPTIAT